jgi:uncharacterized protein YjiS (DUF1127 family)
MIMDRAAFATRFTLPHRRHGLLARLLATQALWRQRRTLASLDDHMLSDIGLTRAQAQAESARPVWDAPGHWQG